MLIVLIDGCGVAVPAFCPSCIELPLKLCAPIAISALNVKNAGADEVAVGTVTLTHSAQFDPVPTHSDGEPMLVTPPPFPKFRRLSIPNVVPFTPVPVALNGISTVPE